MTWVISVVILGISCIICMDMAFVRESWIGGREVFVGISQHI